MPSPAEAIAAAQTMLDQVDAALCEWRMRVDLLALEIEGVDAVTMNSTEVKCHGGPFAGETLDCAQLPDHAFRDGFWELREERAGRTWHGQYVRDEGSAGGRDWDWED